MLLGRPFSSQKRRNDVTTLLKPTIKLSSVQSTVSGPPREELKKELSRLLKDDIFDSYTILNLECTLVQDTIIWLLAKDMHAWAGFAQIHDVQLWAGQISVPRQCRQKGSQLVPAFQQRSHGVLWKQVWPGELPWQIGRPWVTARGKSAKSQFLYHHQTITFDGERKCNIAQYEIGGGVWQGNIANLNWKASQIKSTFVPRHVQQTSSSVGMTAAWHSVFIIETNIEIIPCRFI